MGNLAKDAAHDLSRVEELVTKAQFEIVDKPVDDEYDGCVILLKAIKPLQGVQRSSEEDFDAISDTPRQIAGVSQDHQDGEPPIEVDEDPPSRPHVRLFVSYAHKDSRRVDGFLSKLQEQLGPSKNYRHELWRDNNVLVGEEWGTEIQAALQQCHLGLLLVSPSFLSSEYIAREELAKFLQDDRKPMIPVLLDAGVDFDLHDLKGLDTRQIFRLERNDSRLAYNKCRGTTKDAFVQELFRQLEARVDKLRDDGVLCISQGD